MDFGKSFVFMFQDPNWFRKLAIGTLLILIGIPLTFVLVGLIPLLMVAGYGLNVVRNVLDRREHPMPEWEDWGGFLVRGFKLVAAILIWSLPAIVLSIPVIVGSSLTSNRGGAEAAGGFLIACGACLMLLWVIFEALISPAIYVRLAAYDRFSAAFQLGEIWAFTRDNIGNVILATILILLASWIIVPIVGLLGLVVCLVGVLISIPFSSLWQTLFTAHLYGQIGAYGRHPVSIPAPEPMVPLPAGYGEEAPGVSEETIPSEAPLTVPEEPAAEAPAETPEAAEEAVVSEAQPSPETMVEPLETAAPPAEPVTQEPPTVPEPPTENPGPEEIK